MSQGYNNIRNSYGSQHRSRKRRNRRNNTPILAGLGVVAVLAVIIAGIFWLKSGSGDKTEAEETTEAVDLSRVQTNAVIDLNAVIDNSSGIADDNLINVQGMNKEEIRKAVSDKYDWKLSLINSDARVGDVVKPKVDIEQTTEAATMGDPENPDSVLSTAEETDSADISVSDSIEVPDFISERLEALIEQIFEDDTEALKAAALESTAESSESSKDKKKKKSESESEADAEETASDAKVYALTLDNIDDDIESIAKYACDMWYVEPLGGSIGSYDSATDSFVMEDSRDGFSPDKDKLVSDIKSAVKSKSYTEQIAVTGEKLSAESSANISGAYQTLATFTTKTTSNAVRNKNIELACKKLNGTIVRPGEEFSFNQTVGQRTKEAGYGEAAAYNNGEVVQEVGGGVCQPSTTLYNAVVKAGLKVTARQSHTFKPSYVTPGMDATVSWGGPDFKFANLPSKQEYSYDTSYAIGIKASYSNQTVTVSIYGRPVLKPGYTYTLESIQTKTIEKVRKLIEPGSDKTPTTGSEGSVWEVRLVIKKDGQVVSNNVDHNSLYSGHIEYYTDEVPTESASESESESESIGDAPLGPGGPGNGPGGSDTNVIGPGENTSTTQETTQAETTTAAVSPSPSPSPVTETAASGSNAPGGSSSSSGPIVSPDGPGSLGNTSSGGSGGPGT